MPANQNDDELQQIRNLIILQLIKDGATSDEITLALKARKVSPSNIRTAFKMKSIKKNR
jgi:hypothetical protein